MLFYRPPYRGPYCASTGDEGDVARLLAARMTDSQTSRPATLQACPGAPSRRTSVHRRDDPRPGHHDHLLQAPQLPAPRRRQLGCPRGVVQRQLRSFKFRRLEPLLPLRCPASRDQRQGRAERRALVWSHCAGRSSGADHLQGPRPRARQDTTGHLFGFGRIARAIALYRETRPDVSCCPAASTPTTWQATSPGDRAQSAPGSPPERSSARGSPAQPESFGVRSARGRVVIPAGADEGIGECLSTPRVSLPARSSRCENRT